jgi:hypothetical protein
MNGKNGPLGARWSGGAETVPAQLVGAAGAGVPTITVVGRPSGRVWFRGPQLSGRVGGS